MTTQTMRSKDTARARTAPRSVPATGKKAKAASSASERLRKDARATIAANLARLDAGEARAADDHNEQGGQPVQPAQPKPDQEQGDQHKHVTDPQPGQGAGKKAPAAKAARPTSGKKPKGVKPAADAKPAKAPKAKRLSCLDAAALVIGKDPIGCKDLIAEMGVRKLWTSPNGKTPEASLYAAIIREISAKKGDARFKKVDRGLFVANSAGRSGGKGA